MMGPYVSLIVDGALAALMLTVIAACYFVYRRLATIKEGQTELRQLVDQLNNAVVEAQRSVKNLKHTAAQTEEKLLAETRKASSVADELSMITEAGNNLADRIERGFSERGDNTPLAGGVAAASEAQAASKQQQDILTALKQAR